MRALLDVNVLVALFDPGHAQHRRTRAWWHNNVGSGWASCAITQNGFLRVISQPTYSTPVALSEAFELLKGAVTTTHHDFWLDDISLGDGKRFRHDRILGPRQLTDLYLLGLAVKNEGRFVTLDARVNLGAVVGAEAQHLAIL